MRWSIFFLFSMVPFCYGQDYSPNLLRYYTEEELSEMKQLTPWKYDAILFEFKQSYEWVSGPVDWNTFIDTFDVRRYDHLRQQNANVGLSLENGITILLLSYEEVKNRFLNQHPEYLSLIEQQQKKNIHLKKAEP